MAFLLLTVSCAVKKPVPVIPPISIPETPGPMSEYEIERHIRAEYQKWIGTDHRLGGTNRKGIDCSGFVKNVYQALFDIELPRSTGSQVRVGKPVRRNELRAGDLVFFKLGRHSQHVGIYLSNNTFVHVSEKIGVSITSIDPDYWGRFYWTGRRLLP